MIWVLKDKRGVIMGINAFNSLEAATLAAKRWGEDAAPEVLYTVNLECVQSWIEDDKRNG